MMAVDIKHKSIIMAPQVSMAPGSPPARQAALQRVVMGYLAKALKKGLPVAGQSVMQ